MKVLKYAGRRDPETGETETIEIVHKAALDHVTDVITGTGKVIKNNAGPIGLGVFLALWF